MPKEQLKQLLLDLKAHSKAQSISDEKQSQLQNIDHEVSSSIESEPLNDDFTALQEELKALEVEFEVSHPSLAYIIKNIIETLAKIGI